LRSIDHLGLPRDVRCAGACPGEKRDYFTFRRSVHGDCNHATSPTTSFAAAVR
jgi:hypothetical protein